jgi:hemolysin activation/secretion protein
MLKPLSLAVLVALAPLAHAAEPPVSPDAGNILQQLKPTTPPPPANSSTGLSIQGGKAGQLPDSAAFLVQRLTLSGNSHIDSATLHALIADAEGKSLTLAQLGAVANRITEYYHTHDYPLARAVIPAQTIKDGVVDIQVLEASYGKVTLKNESRVRDALLEATLAPLKSGDVIEQSELDHVLLLLSDVPKIAVQAVIKPGEAVGTSNLDVTALPGPSVTGIATVDDYGNRYTGRTRFGGTVSIMEPLQQGDYLSLSGLTSGDDMNYARLSYEATVTGSGTRLGAAYSGLHYKLGDGLESLHGDGTATVASLWGKQPLVRGPALNVYAQIQYDRVKLDDSLDADVIRTDRHLDNFTASLTGDVRDASLAGAVSTANLSVTAGRVDFDNASAQIADAATAKSDGTYSKWNVNLARLQKLTATNGLYLSFAGQWSRDNLDSSEKLIGGGPYTVRAYDLGVVSGDTGVFGTAEFQHDLGSWWNGQWQGVIFYDSEHLTVDKKPWVAGANVATLNGAGMGLNWSGPHHWSAKASVATRIGGLPYLAGDNASVHVWAEINREF